MIAAIFSGLSLFTLWYINFVRPKRRSRELKAAADPFFLVPSRSQHDCDYARQDDEEHILKELSVSPNTDIIIDFIIKVKSAISYSELSIGFMGDLDKTPYATKYHNRYVSIGRGREIDPALENSDDFVDKHLYYHRRVSRSISAGTVLSLAFSIKTRGAGLYPLRFLFISDEPLGEGATLFLTVEETPSVVLRCVESTHKNGTCTKGALARN
jgi:hypothetical protein